MIWTNPTTMNGRIFPNMRPVLSIGVTTSCSSVPRSRSRTMAMLVISTIVSESRTSMIPCTM